MAGQQIDIVANLLMKVDGAEAGINKLKNSLSRLKLPDNIDKGLSKSFTNLEGIFERYRNQLSKGFNTKGDVSTFAKTGKELELELNKVSKYMTELTGKQIDFKVNSEPIKRAEQDLEKLLQKQKQLVNTTLSLKIEGADGSKSNSIETILKDIQRIAGSTNAGKAAGAALANLQMGDLEGAKAKVEEVINAYKRLGQTKRDAMVADTGLNISDAATKVKSQLDNVDNGLQKVKDDAAATTDALNKMRSDQINKATNEALKMAKALEKDAAAAGQANKAAQEYASSSLRMAQQIDQLKSSTQYFFGLRNMLNLLKRGFHEALNTVKELDAAMTETAVVTKFDIGDMWEKLPEYTANANALGATVQDMYKSATLYYQQGLGEEQAMSIAAETMKMARIGGLEAADATDKMTAALRGFNMELNEVSAQRVNDVYSNLAAKTASNTEELGTAMQRTASIASSAGMSFEGTAAFLAQAIETTREPAENLGTAMKTIVARFQELKKNPLEMEEVDGEVVDYNKVDTALKTIGVDLKDTNGQFRDLDQVFLDISQRWDSLTQTQQRYIATTAAGSRQQSRFIAMMSNYERTQELMSYANDSAGASSEQFGKTMESMEAKLNKLKNAWELFTMGLASNDMLKGGVDFITKLITGITNLIDTLSLGSSKLKSVLTIFTAFTGLRVAGQLINGVLGGLGGMLDPRSSILKGAFGGGLIGSQRGNAAVQAKLINQPIVSVLNQILGAIRTGKTGGPNSETRANYKQALSNFRTSANEKNATISGTLGTLKGLDAQQVRLISKSNIGTMSQLQNSMAQTDMGKVLAAQIITAMKRGSINGNQVASLNRANIGSILGTKEAQAYSESFAKNVQQNILPKWQETQKAVENKIRNTARYSNPELFAQLTDSQGKQLSHYDLISKTRINSETKQVEENPYYSQAYVDKFKELTAAEKEAIKQSAALGDNILKQKTPLQSIQQSLSHVGGAAITAGQGLMSLGATLNSMGFEAAGAAVSSFGSALSNLGMIANGIPSILGLIAKLANPVGLAVAAVGVGVFALSKHLKAIKEEGEKITTDFSDKTKTAEDNITKLQSYQGEFEALSQGVDANGNNVSLDDSSYRRYLEIVDSIAEINPEIVDGYNQQGHAIIKNNKALQKTLEQQQDIKQEAYDTYTKEESLQKLINARNVNADYEKGVKNYTGTKSEDSGRLGNAPFAAEVSSLAGKLSTNAEFESILEKYGINSLDALKNGEAQAVKNFVKHRKQIEEELSNSGEELSDAVTKGFSKLDEKADAFDEAIKPIYDNLLAGVSKSKLFESLAPEIQEAYKDSLKDLASKDLSAKEMQKAAGYLSMEFQAAFDNAQPLLEQADEALNTFTKDLNEAAYNDSAEQIAESFQVMADNARAAGQIEIAEWYENQAARIKNAITESVETIADNIDTLADNIAVAKTNFEALGKGVDDYYTLADQAYGLTQTALEEKNIEGEGSKTFWNTYRGLASKEAFEEHDFDKALANMKQFQKYFTEGAAGSEAFAQKIVDWQEKDFKITGKNGDLVNAKLKDFFELAKDGTLHVTDAFTDLTDEQYAQIASIFDLSADGFTAVLNKLRQFGDLEFDDVRGVRKALALDERSVKTDKEVKVEGEKEPVNRLYYGQSVIDAETADWDPDKKENFINDLNVQGSIQLPHGAEELIKKGTGDTEDGSLLKQFVSDTKGQGNQVQNVLQALYQTQEYNKEDLEKIHTALTTDEQYGLTNAADAGVNFDTIFNNLEALTDPAKETNNYLSGISSTVDTIASIVAAGKVGEGFLPDVAKQSSNLYNELVGKKGEVDTWAQKFAHGQDENGYAITDKAKFNEIYAKLDAYKTANDNYINELKEGRAAAEARGASAEELDNFDNEIKAAEQNAELISLYMQSAKDSAEKVETDFYNAGQTVFKGFADIRNNPNLTPEEQKTKTADVLTGFVKQLQDLNFSPEAIQGIFDKNFGDLGIKFDIENGEFASEVGQQINDQLSNLDQANIDAVLNISSIKMATAAGGKNNTSAAIHRVGTMARGSKKKGYTINGEPTLTGELGPELVWEPRQNAAYMVGEHGPQFANISKNAVVWNAEQTKKIKKNSKGISPLGTGANGIHNVGTMAEGNMTLPGTFSINANASILEVVPPTPEPEIPVKANLEVEGESTGGILGKLFGSEQGPTINVAANVTSINTTEQSKTIKVIGDISELKTNTRVNNVEATATVTQVTKSAQVSGEPVTVKAIATTTQVKNNTPTQKESGETKTVKVSANTDALQSKINRIFNKTYTLKYKASGPSSISVPISANFTGSWQKTVTIHRSGAKGINNKINTSSIPSFGSAAAGHYGTIGPRNKGGLTLTGEKGFEIAWLPGENRSMVLGAKGPQMLELPPDAVVYTHEQSKKILKQKAIPAGSHDSKGKQSASGNNIAKHLNINVGGSKGTNNNNKGTNKQNKTDDKNDKNADKAKKVINNVGKVSAYWENIARQTEATQRLMDKNAKVFEKYVKEMRATLHMTGVSAPGGGGGDDYIASINKYKQLNISQRDTAAKELKNASTSKSKTKISYKKGNKTKDKKVQLSKYITYNNDLGIYEINQDELNKVKNKNEAKAIKEAAEKKINEKQSKKNTAEDNIQKAEEALEKFGEELYKTFFAWETELTEIWNITQKIAEVEKRISRTKAYTELLEARIASGTVKANEVYKQSISNFETGVLAQRTNLNQNIDALKKEREDLQRTMSLGDEKATLNSIKGFLSSGKGPDGRVLNETDREGYVKWGENLEQQINALDDAWKYLTVSQKNDGTLDVDFKTDIFEKDKTAGLIGEEKAKVIQDYVKSLNEKSEAINSRIETITNSTAEFYSQLASLKDEWAGYADQLWDISDAEQKKEVDNFKKLSDSLDKAMKNLLDGVKQKLDERRQQEDNKKTEQDISQKQQRLAMLQADTSGGHQVEIAQLQQEIGQAQQDYQRTLEDQMLEKLEQQADIATQQREQQIALQEGTIDAINNASLVNTWLAKPEDYKQQMYEAFMTANEADKKPDAIKEQLERQFEELYLGIITNKKNQEALTTQIDQIEKGAIKLSDLTGEVGILDGIKASIDNINAPGQSKTVESGGKVTEGGTKATNDAAKNGGNSGGGGGNSGGSNAKLDAYNKELANRKQAKKINKDQVNKLFKLGAEAGKGKASVLKDIVSGDPFSWKNAFKAIIDADGITRYNLVKTWPNGDGTLADALKTLGKPNTLAAIKKHASYAKAKPLAFKTGGLADYTGPAWLDGTPSKPELVLNSTDTKNFVALKDVLSKAMGSTNAIENTYGGDTTFEININVDHLNNDYDVDKVAERVKKIIVKDSSYRNVTQVRNFR